MLERGVFDVLGNGKLRLASVSEAHVGVNIRVSLFSIIQIFTFVVWLQLLASSQIFCGQESIVKIAFRARQTWKLNLSSKTY